METILVPTDFSPAADNALRYAVKLAEFFDARLTLVHAYQIPVTGADTGFSVNLVNDWKQDIEKRLEEKKTEILRNTRRDLAIECIAEIGPVYDVISSVSEDVHADLVVMGIIGEAGKIRERIIGSSAVKVARNINIPTFIIPEKANYRPIHKISFACDMEDTEETIVISVAKYFSKVFESDLEIVNVEKPEEEVTYEKAVTNLFIERKLNHVRHRTVFITENRVAKGLETYFETHPTDVIMLNPKKHNIFYHLFRESVTNELAFHVRVPILAIH